VRKVAIFNNVLEENYMRKLLSLMLCVAIFILSFGVVACKSDSGNASQQQIKASTSNKNSDKDSELKKYIALAKEADKKVGKGTEYESFKWWRKAAELGDIEAQYQVGQSYFLGFRAEQDIKQALYWLSRPAQEGHAEAQFKVGYIYDEYYNDFDKAFQWYNKAAQQGHAEAQYHLAQCYEEGIGTKKNEKEAFNLYKKLTEQGHAFALLSLADCYRKGTGVSKNNIKAKELYEKALKNEDTAGFAKIELDEMKEEKNNNS
jgi:TPR repeat protein